jgi:hypothetical protein
MHPQVENAYFPPFTDSFYGDHVDYSCRRDYWFPDRGYDLSITCAGNASWTPTIENNCSCEWGFFFFKRFVYRFFSLLP